LTANEIAEKFSIRKQTIYRNIKAMEQVVDTSVMFTESVANALLTAEKLILKNKE
jgi:hypothetical protein